jgi:integrase
MTDRQLRARILLEEAHALGIELDDLLAAARTTTAIPTVAAYLDTIAPTFTPATARTYRPYWRLLITHLGDHHLLEVTTADLTAVVAAAGTRAQIHRPGSTGRASRESCVAALRAVFSRAADAGITVGNPAAALIKPRRAPSRRRALTEGELSDLIDAVRTTSHDPDFDLLLIRLHLESGARREGALNLRCRDLDGDRATVWLREKGDSEREQPISPSLLALLEHHAAARGATRPDDPVLRTANGASLSARRYSTIFDRARTCLPWAERTPVSAHVLRHTAITAVGRIAGYPVAQAFAGHSPPTVTGRYLHATLDEIATAVAHLTGEPHPLATSHLRRHGPCRRR